MGSGAAFEVFADLDRTKRRRTKRTPFDKSQRYYKNNGNTFVFPKATEAQLESIRKKIKKQQRLDRLKSILAFIIGAPLAFIIFIGIIYLLTS